MKRRKTRFERGIQFRCVESMSKAVVIGYLQCKQASSGRCSVSAVWVYKISIGGFHGKQNRSVREKENIVPAQKNLKKIIEGGEELEISWSRTDTDLRLLQFKEVNVRKTS